MKQNVLVFVELATLLVHPKFVLLERQGSHWRILLADGHEETAATIIATVHGARAYLTREFGEQEESWIP